MAQYRKKPVVVEAVRLTWESVLRNSPDDIRLPDWILNNERVKVFATEGIFGSEYLIIDTPEGMARANHHDFIVKEDGELFPFSPKLFEATYEALERKPLPTVEVACLEAPILQLINVIRKTELLCDTGGSLQTIKSLNEVQKQIVSMLCEVTGIKVPDLDYKKILEDK